MSNQNAPTEWPSNAPEPSPSPAWANAPYRLALALIDKNGRPVEGCTITNTAIPYRWANEADARHDFTRLSNGLRPEWHLPKTA